MAARCSGRYVHFLAGVTWIGMLYYFNFVQTPAFAEVSDATRSEAMRTITWRALWWFRFGALLTFLSGDLDPRDPEVPGLRTSTCSGRRPTAYRSSSAPLFGITMFLNVWLVIWPAQQVIIGSARKVAEGGEADPERRGPGQARGPRLPGQHPDVDPDALLHGVHVALLVHTTARRRRRVPTSSS